MSLPMGAAVIRKWLCDYDVEYAAIAYVRKSRKSVHAQLPG